MVETTATKEVAGYVPAKGVTPLFQAIRIRAIAANGLVMAYWGSVALAVVMRTGTPVALISGGGVLYACFLLPAILTIVALTLGPAFFIRIVTVVLNVGAASWWIWTSGRAAEGFPRWWWFIVPPLLSLIALGQNASRRGVPRPITSAK